MPTKPILLYSTNTWLAFIIAERYYGGQHYVWCTPHFDPSTAASIHYTVPPSSSPIEIYRGLRNDVAQGDRHSPKIAANKIGILSGVKARRAAGSITGAEAEEITSILDASEIRDFRPLFYVIPFNLVADRVEAIPINQRAHPLSVEYIIKALPRDCFDVIGEGGI